MEKPNVLIIGAGGVAQVTAHKVAQRAAEFGEIHMANRTQSRADAIVDSIREKGTAAGRTITTHALDAMDAGAVAALNSEFADEGIAPLDIGIGINTGSCIVKYLFFHSSNFSLMVFR